MRASDFVWGSALAALGAYIWFCGGVSRDALPILAALPLFYWLGAPWHFVAIRESLSIPKMAAACAFLVVGALGDLTLLLAIGWTILLWVWLRPRLSPERQAIVRRLLVLPLLAFPWILHDCEPLAWWFRLSAAAVAQGVFSAIGFDVLREGTNLLVQGTPIAVEPACAGLETLQAMLIAGCAPAFIHFGEKGGARYWFALLALLAMSWIANTARVIAIVVAAISFGSEVAGGAFHEFGGWLVLFAMFALCCWAFSFANRALQGRGAHA